MRRWLLQVCVLQCSIAGCGGNHATCTQDDQCASHFCRADGTCGPTADVDAAVGDSDGDAPSGVCAPDHDGMIARAELPLEAGRKATFRVAPNPSFDTAGKANTDGSRTWDMTGHLAGDADRPVELLSPVGAWWQPSFPDATYAVQLAANSDLLGVFQVTDAQVALLGVVSPEAGTFRTELAYDPPAQILALPFAAGATWSSTSSITGPAQGTPTAYSERYASRVDQVGTLKAPYGEFPVVRIATDLTRTAGAAVLLTKRTFAWAAECFGSVAQVQSQDFETTAEFNDPAEVRRLAP